MSSNIYTTLIGKLETLLNSVDEVSKVYMHPVDRLKEYPSVVCIPTSYESSFETNQENLEIRRFKLVVVVGAVQTTIKTLYTSVLPKTVDSIRDKFAENWDGGSIDGHRVWYKLDSGEWGTGETDKGLEAWCELYLDIKLLTDN